VGSLVLGPRCSLRHGSAPMPMITALHKSPSALKWRDEFSG